MVRAEGARLIALASILFDRRRRLLHSVTTRRHTALGKAGNASFGAERPAHCLPRCNIEAMQLHLDEIAKDIEPGRHAVLMLDKAGWHTSPKLDVPNNLTLLPLPAKCPELNPVENVWEFMRDNWFSNRIFLNYDDIVDHCCDAWNKLRNQPWSVMSIGLRDWAHRP